MFDLIQRHDILDILWQIGEGLEVNTLLEVTFEQVRPLPRLEVQCAGQTSAFDFPQDDYPQAVPVDFNLGITHLPPAVLRRHTQLVYIAHTFIGAAVQCKLHVTIRWNHGDTISITFDRCYPGFDRHIGGMQTFRRIECDGGDRVTFKNILLGGSHL